MHEFVCSELDIRVVHSISTILADSIRSTRSLLLDWLVWLCAVYFYVCYKLVTSFHLSFRPWIKTTTVYSLDLGQSCIGRFNMFIVD